MEAHEYLPPVKTCPLCGTSLHNGTPCYQNERQPRKRTMTDQEKIDRIMRDFDFNKVRRVMKAMNWMWYDTPKPHVPTIEEMKETALFLLTYVCQEGGELAIGGFQAVLKLSGDLELMFVLESQEWENI